MLLARLVPYVESRLQVGTSRFADIPYYDTHFLLAPTEEMATQVAITPTVLSQDSTMATLLNMGKNLTQKMIRLASASYLRSTTQPRVPRNRDDRGYYDVFRRSKGNTVIRLLEETGCSDDSASFTAPSMIQPEAPLEVQSESNTSFSDVEDLTDTAEDTRDAEDSVSGVFVPGTTVFGESDTSFADVVDLTDTEDDTAAAEDSVTGGFVDEMTVFGEDDDLEASYLDAYENKSSSDSAASNFYSSVGFPADGFDYDENEEDPTVETIEGDTQENTNYETGATVYNEDSIDENALPDSDAVKNASDEDQELAKLYFEGTEDSEADDDDDDGVEDFTDADEDKDNSSDDNPPAGAGTGVPSFSSYGG